MALLDNGGAAPVAPPLGTGGEQEEPPQPLQQPQPPLQSPPPPPATTASSATSTPAVASASASASASPLSSVVADRLFRGTVNLAPMVRAGTLPFRLLCLGYGADVVWGEEVIDRKMLGCERRANARLGTVDFVNRKDGRLIFSTTAAEKGRVIFQLGASPRNPEWAVRAALLVAGYVAGIDVNMGCPKAFSVQDGMGAALLENEAGAAGLIRALRAALPAHVPVTCKMRLLDSPERTLAFARAMEAAGCAAIGVHMRTRTDKPTEPARWDAIRPLVQGLRIPVIANGDIYTREHLAAVREAAGDPRLAVMLARPALFNPSVFRVLKGAEGGEEQQQLEPLDGAMRAYVRLCLRFENHCSNSKATLMEMLCRRRHPDHLKAALPLEAPPGKSIPVISRLKTTAAIAALWGLDPEAEGPAATPAGAAGEGEGEGERLGLHVCSDSYFAVDGAVVLDGGEDGKEEETKRGMEEEEDGEQAAAPKRARAE